MPRITLLRVVFLVLAFYFSLIIAFYTIPSPNYQGYERDEHINQVLNSGRTLTTIHHYDDTFEQFYGEASGVEKRWSTHLAIDWRLEPCHKTNSHFLHIGDKSLNLTDISAQHALLLGRAEGYRVKTCNTVSSDLSAPFSPADEALLSHQLEPRYDTVALRYLAIDPNRVEIWKDADGWANFTKLADIDDDDRRYGLLATFSGIPDRDAGEQRPHISHWVVTNIKGLLPSKTFSVRSALLTIWAPLLKLFVLATYSLGSSIVLVVFGGIYAIMHLVAIYLIIVLVVWLTKGRPEFVSWSRQFWMTRWLYRFIVPPRGRIAEAKVWGATGPIDMQDEDAEEDENTVQQRTPVRTPLDFFRSRSPLDDLLGTFQSTQWMVEPLRLRSRQLVVGMDPEAVAPVGRQSNTTSLDEKTKVRITL